ncbi:MAG TPA: ABC transporter ATP-binding protein [Vicinamibacterales bacterium]|nr:ABC transporter ATP-binding protein [Vicinamibacterales bacterium]HPW21984.1 ABC transporter ATP-binding protein [Vicinamibacterales bacterium]
MRPSPTRRLATYLLRYTRGFVLGLACTGLSTAFGLATPWVLKLAVDDLAASATGAKFRTYALLVLGLALAGGAFRFLMRRIIVGVSRRLEFDLRNDLFARLLTLPPAYYHAHRTGDLMSRATNDLNAVRMMAGPAIMYITETAIVFAVAIVLMAGLDARLTAVALIPLPFVSIAARRFGAAIHRRFEGIQAQLSALSAVVQEALSGVRVVRAYRQEEAEFARFADANTEYVRRNLGLIRVQSAFFPGLGLLLGLGGLLVLWLGSRDVIHGRITLGEFVAFNAYMAMLTWPMIAFGWVTNMLQRGAASWQRMLEVLDAEPAVPDLEPDPARPAVGPIRGGIEFRGLTFAFDGAPVLRDVSVAIEAGRTLAIVGPTGSGKSTLINLIPRLYDPPRGTVFIDGTDVRDIPLAALRGAIGFVSQEPFLFSESLGENIGFGTRAGAAERPAASQPPAATLDEPLAAAASVACLDKDVRDFPEGYATMVGERGITLSGGQKQRTALARAIAIDPRILILDDALSAVDTYTEEEILSRLRGVMRERTSVIVSHRISTVRDADLVILLDGGRIVERGSHDELVALGGAYAGLYRKQLLEEELEGDRQEAGSERAGAGDGQQTNRRRAADPQSPSG